MVAVVIIEAVVIVLLLVLVAGLLKSHAEILRRLDQIGSSGDVPAQAQRLRTTGLGKAPTDQISGVDPVGSAVSISLEHGRGETLLSFLSTGCASCRVFWEQLGGTPDLPTPSTRPVIVTKGPQAESPAKVADLARGGVRVVMSDEAWDTFRVPLTPYFMLVDGRGDVIGEGSATNMSHLLGLFRQSAADSSPVRLSTRERERLTDDQLSSSGIEPGDPSLYEDPLRE
ncbi:MAG TPA: hypothetical protein VF148_16220 [Acidimicrobiia bacterium]